MYIAISGIIEFDGEMDHEQLIELNCELAEWMEDRELYFSGVLRLKEEEEDENQE